MQAAPVTSRDPESWDIERRSDGVFLVRVHSVDRRGRQLPDAVFTFRLGDPQYGYWEEKWRNTRDERSDSAV